MTICRSILISRLKVLSTRSSKTAESLLNSDGKAGLKNGEIDGLFKGAGFERLVLAGGGVPRDCLSLSLTVLDAAQPPNGDGRIGKDEVRISSRSNFERRIADLKQDSGGSEQLTLIRGVVCVATTVYR